MGFVLVGANNNIDVLSFHHGNIFFIVSTERSIKTTMPGGGVQPAVDG